MKKIIYYIKKEVVLTVAWVLAIISMFIIHPSKEYASYIDWRTLGILWGLMIIMEGLKKNLFFDVVGNWILSKTKKVSQLAFVLVFLCFFFSMLITNDVALITFVPFAVIMLRKCDREDLLIPVIVLQTIAANLGSMLTPIGNPQNLYLYGLSGVSLGQFVMWMLPYTIAAGVALAVSILILIKGGKIESFDHNSRDDVKESADPDTKKYLGVWSMYFLLFILALAVVGRFIPFYVLVLMVFIVILIADTKLLIEIDYTLLFTFIGFFIFTGNIGNIPQIYTLMEKMVTGHELVFGIALSQIISNVPATLLLSGFTSNIKSLLIGVNLGGLGTLIASMASLISYKILQRDYSEKRAKYFIFFTVMNVIFLVFLVVVKLIGTLLL